MIKKSHAVLVLGMHRSGTSAATGALVLRGAWPGARLLPASSGNPKGYWENEGVHAVHETLLRALGHAWDDPRPLPEGWLHQDAAINARDQLRSLIMADLVQHPIWVVKDPRLCRLLPLWRPLLEELGVSASAVIVVRDPREVAASLQTRSSWPLDLSRELWWQHLADAIDGSEGMSPYVLPYSRLLADPMAEIDALVEALNLNVPSATEDVIEKINGFISQDIRHHHVEADTLPGWEAAVSLYHQLSTQPVPWQKVWAALRANTLAAQPLGTVVCEYARLYTDQRNTLHATGNQLTKTDHELAQVRGELGQVQAELQHTRGELNHVRGELNHTRGELNHVRGELNHTRGELNHVRGELNHTRGELDHVRGELDHAHGGLNMAKAELQAQQAFVQQLLNSRSWRLTRPLRWLGGLGFARSR